MVKGESRQSYRVEGDRPILVRIYPGWMRSSIEGLRGLGLRFSYHNFRFLVAQYLRRVRVTLMMKERNLLSKRTIHAHWTKTAALFSPNALGWSRISRSDLVPELVRSDEERRLRISFHLFVFLGTSVNSLGLREMGI